MLTEIEVGVGVNDSVGVKEGICEQATEGGSFGPRTLGPRTIAHTFKKNRDPVVCGSEQAREEECSGPPKMGPGNTAGKWSRPDGTMPVELDPP